MTGGGGVDSQLGSKVLLCVLRRFEDDLARHIGTVGVKLHQLDAGSAAGPQHTLNRAGKGAVSDSFRTLVGGWLSLQGGRSEFV